MEILQVSLQSIKLSTCSSSLIGCYSKVYSWQQKTEQWMKSRTKGPPSFWTVLARWYSHCAFDKPARSCVNSSCSHVTRVCGCNRMVLIYLLFFIINNFISWKVYVGITCGITIDIALILLTIERDRPAQSHCYIDNLHNITIRLTPLLTLGNVLLPIGYNGERTSIYRCIREVYPVLMAGDSYIFSCQHRKSNTCGLCGLINTTGNQMYYRCISQCARAMPKLL